MCIQDFNTHEIFLVWIRERSKWNKIIVKFRFVQNSLNRWKKLKCVNIFEEFGCGNTDIPIEKLQNYRNTVYFWPKIPISTASVDTVFPLIFFSNPKIPLQKRPNTVIPWNGNHLRILRILTFYILTSLCILKYFECRWQLV